MTKQKRDSGNRQEAGAERSMQSASPAQAKTDKEVASQSKAGGKRGAGGSAKRKGRR